MNYLAHALLSFGDEELLTGNMIADYVKGSNVLVKFPKKIKEGIILHRYIDQFADDHPASKQAATLFKENYGRYSPAIIDSLFDHYLANDRSLFPTEENLFAFSQKTYQQLAIHEAHFPEKFAGFFFYMKEQNWLYNYRTHQGMNRSLYGLHRRAKYMPLPDLAFEIFMDNYTTLNNLYDRLIIEMISFVLEKINNLD